MSTTRRTLACIVAVIALVAVPSVAYAVNEPVLTGTSPAAGSSVQAAPTVSATYDRGLHPSSTIVVEDTTDNAIGGTTTFVDAIFISPGNEAIVFTPSSPLTQAGSPYTATVVARSTDLALLQGTTNTEWNFFVDATPPPRRAHRRLGGG